MSVLKGYQPENVLHWFERLCAIPHGSFHTGQISAFLADFARERSLPYVRDGADNVVIFAPGTPGYEQSAPVILQGHMDMVCEKEPGCDIDFLTDGLRLRVEDGYLTAEGTTLGGDDGIAVAYALALLDSSDIPHPPLEVVITADEEVGMLGAAALDCSVLQGRTMVNLDSEEEGFLLVSCAGGLTADCCLPLARESASGLAVTLSVEGLTGGHSGAEIHKGRASAVVLLGRLLWALEKALPFRLIALSGGGKDNAIPRSAGAEILIDPAQLGALEDFAAGWQGVFAHEYAATDPALQVSVSGKGQGVFQVLTPLSHRNAVAALVQMPFGVQRMSQDMEGLVQTSLNLGILSSSETELHAVFSVRSSVQSEKEALYARLENLMELLGGSVTATGDYPPWEYRKDSPLRELMTQVFREQYGREPEVMAIHAGLECGLFSGRLPELDCVSIGPDMDDIHTTKERLSLASVERTWRYLCEVLKRLK